MGWQVEMLGPIGLTIDGEPCALQGPKQHLVVAALALSPGRTLHLERLVDLIWGDDPPPTARRTVQAHVSKVRAASGSVVRSNTSGYVIDVERSAVDLLAWHDESIEALELVRDDPTTAARSLRDLDHRWAEPLGGLGETDSFAAVLAPFRALLIQVREGLATAQIDSGAAGAAVRALEDLTRANPTNEAFWLQLVRGYVALDRRNDALATIQRAREALREELGVDLGPRLAEYEIEVLDGDGTSQSLAVSRPAARLRNDNLRPEPNGFVDRREIENVEGMLQAGRVITIVGPGGIGKSRCATAIGRRCIEAGTWPDGVWFVDLAVLPSDTPDIAASVASAIGLGREDASASTAALAEYLQARRVLLILDNCEHVRAAAQQFMSELLGLVTHTAVLATSRVRISLPQEQTIVLATLSPDESRQLYFARVNEAGAGPFPVDDIDELCSRLDHYPLALELAAARTRALTPREIIDRLEQHPMFAQSGPRIFDTGPIRKGELSTRHDSLNLALDWSLTQLEPGPLQTLHRAAVFTGDFDLAAAEAVLADDSATIDAMVADIGDLVEHHLIERDHRRGRYRILEPIRQTLISAAPVSSELQRRHATFYCAQARMLASGVFGESEAICWDRLRAEGPQLGDAVRWAAANGDVDLVETAMERMASVISLAVYTEPGNWAEDARGVLQADPLATPWTSLAVAAAWAHSSRLEECDAMLDTLESSLTDAQLRATMYGVRVQRDQANAGRWVDNLYESASAADDKILMSLALNSRREPGAVAFADTTRNPSTRTVARIYALATASLAEKSNRIDLTEELYGIALSGGCSYVIAQAQIYHGLIQCLSGNLRAGAELVLESIERNVRLRSSYQVWHAVETAANVLGLTGFEAATTVALWSAVDGTEHPPLARVYRNDALPGMVESQLTDDEIAAARLSGARLSMDEAAAIGRKAIERLGTNS